MNQLGNVRPEVNLVIVDLDNTLYDWVGSFVPPFYAMVEAASVFLDVPQETLLEELQAVHRLHGSSEHPYALLETAAVQRQFPDRSRTELRELLSPVFHVFNKKRKDALRLYDGVDETLRAIVKSGVSVVAYTDARIHNSLFRMSRLQLVPLISRLYAPRHTVESEPPGPSPEYLESIPEGYVRLLSAADRKPNPATLLDICDELRVPSVNALYIGDSLVRDVYMAQQAGLHNAWARYGSNYDRKLWPMLVRVTHWTADDVAREDQMRERAGKVVPEFAIDCFADILDYYAIHAPSSVVRHK